nr:DNA mismatch repair endonuclease MutL [Halobellus sp. DFY28]
MRELDDRTVRQIAAGEVVERPASVVKELVENSLDAGADRISVAVEAGGTEGIRVRDDGRGMDRESVERAVEEHTTSKIDDIDDLEAGVGTLGFRGEALHTIGAVSRLTVRTKPRGGDGAGTELRVEGGEVTDVGPAGCPEGTVVEVADLFYNTPARRKFLKTTATEFDHINTVVTHYALANPDVAISLEHDDREVFATEGRGSRQSAVLAVYGREVAESMIRVDAEPETSAESDSAGGSTAGDSAARAATADGDGPVESVSGLVSHPETTRSTREYLSTFVNGRYVTSSVLREAVLDAYGGQLAGDRYPFAVLFVDVPADSVDVNVHPRKMEVRYNEPEAVKDAVRTAIEDALREEGILRSSAPRGRSAPEETQIDPVTPDDTVELAPDDTTASKTQDTTDRGSEDAPELSADETTDQAPEEVPELSTDDSTGKTVTDPDTWSVRTSDSVRSPSSTSRSASAEPETDSTSADPASQSETRSELASGVSNAGDPNADTQDADVADISDTDVAGFSDTDTSDADVADISDTDTSDAEVTDFSDTDSPDRDAKARPSGQHRSQSSTVSDPNTQTTLTGGDATPETRYENLPNLRVLGQLHDTYIVAEADDGLLLVDQHAADERVNYERLRKRFDGDTTAQELAEPVEVELTAREAAAFDDFREALARLGFHADRIGDRTIAVSTVPALLAEAAGPEVVRDVLVDLVADGTDADRTVDSIADELLSDMACHPSITGNTSLTEGSVVDLLSALDDCENPWSCPHGRPVLIHIDSAEIDDRFERDYPGH